MNFEKPANAAEVGVKKYERELALRDLNLSALQGSEMRERLDSDENDIFKDGNGGFKNIENLSIIDGVENTVFERVRIDGSTDEIEEALSTNGLDGSQYVGYGTGRGNVGFTLATAESIREKIARYGLDGNDELSLFIPKEVTYDE